MKEDDIEIAEALRVGREDHVAALLLRAAELGLGGVEFLDCLGFDVVCREYNGIGPEWAGEALRDRATHRLALFEPAALVHDLRNFRSDGTREGFRAANAEFLENCLTLANAEYPWWSWRRWRARVVAYALYDFVSGPGGWKAWMDCYNRKETRK